MPRWSWRARCDDRCRTCWPRSSSSTTGMMLVLQPRRRRSAVPRAASGVPAGRGGRRHRSIRRAGRGDRRSRRPGARRGGRRGPGRAGAAVAPARAAHRSGERRRACPTSWTWPSRSPASPPTRRGARRRSGRWPRTHRSTCMATWGTATCTSTWWVRRPRTRRSTGRSCELAIAMGGTISAEHGIGVAKVDWLERDRGAADVAAMRAIKQALDPDLDAEPGRAVRAPRAGRSASGRR